MRSALSLKPSNGNAAKSQAVNNKNVIKNAPLGGKLTRQIGTSNLLQQALPSKKIDESPIIKIDAKDSFKVFEDQEPEKENSSENVDATEKDSNVIPAEDNNMIHELERKMEEKSRAEKLKFKFMQTRDNSDITSRFSEPPSEFSVLCDDDDCDKVSVASSTFTTSVRATFSSFHFDENQRKKEFGKEEAVKKIQKKAAKEARDDSMFSSEEFFPDIIKYMLHRQTKNRASHECFDIQSQVNEEMRTILIDWFSDVVKEYNFQKETFHLAVSLVDRALSMFNIDKMRFQLVGTTSMMIAVKYEEIFPPEIEDFALITDNTYRVPDILLMERFLLGKFDFVVAMPTSSWFGTCFAKRMNFTKKMRNTVHYLLELSLIDVHFLRYRPSDIAAAACCFANLQADVESWPQKMVDDTGISTEDFVDVLRDLHRMYLNASTADFKSIFYNYSETAQMEVALLPAPTDKLRSMFPSIFVTAPKSSNDSSSPQ